MPRAIAFSERKRWVFPHGAAVDHAVGPNPSPMKLRLLFGLLLLFFLAAAQAQVPNLINYQGRVAVGSPAVNFDGAGQFKFALVDAAGTTTYWSNDGTSNNGTEPGNAVALTVTKGLYSVLLGDTSLPNMTA